MRNSIVGILCFAGFCITGCGTGEDQDLPEEGTRSNQTYAAGGSKWGCKTCGFSNVPIWGTREVDTATYGSGSSQTLPSYALLIDPSGDGWDVTFEKGELVATNGVDDVRGHDLIGWRLLAKWPDGDEMEAEIYGFRWVADWTVDQHPIPTYGFATVGASGDFDNNVCPGLELDETSVVFLHDERYDLSDGSVIPEDWVVTTACRGFALAKMAMLGYRPYDNPSGGDDREATLRMIRADYCGDGTSYTGIGVPMDWVDANANVVWDPLTMSNRLEAHWTRQGAECIGVMRRPDLHPEFDPTEPDRDLPPICGLPQCSNDHFDGEIEGVWSSMVPLVP